MAADGNVVIRPIAPEEYEAWARHTMRAFGGTPDPERMERNRPNIDLRYATGAFDGDEVVGTALHEPTTITLPGGAQLGCTGVTRVSVAATHRRRGILRAIMAAHDQEFRSLHLPLAALWASEASIYQRFGYGLASLEENWRLERAYTGLGWWVPEPHGTLRYASADTAQDTLKTLLGSYAESRPAGMQRLSYRWDNWLADHEGSRGGLSPLQIVIHEAGGVPDGYVAYRLKGGWEDELPSAVLHVEELVATSAAAEVDLWRHVSGVDLVRTIEAIRQPADGALPWALADMRRLQRRIKDGLWLRVLDLPAAFEARQYLGTGRIVLEVDDPMHPDAAGRFVIEASPEGAHVARTDAPADLEVRAAAVGSLLMATQSATVLARSGLIIERSPEAARRADELFRWHQAAHCLYFF